MNATVTETNSGELLALRRREVEVQRQRLAAIKSFGLRYYRPHPKQDAFHRSTAKRRMVRSGNRFGKSHMGCAEDCAWAMGERPWYPENDPARTAGIPRHPVKGLIITTDWDKVDEIWTSERGDNPGKIWRYLPPGFVKSKRRNHSGAIDTIECHNGSVLRFDTVKSFMANPLGSESSDWDFIHVDEPCPEAMYKASARGLVDRNGSAWFTLTPLREWWINDYFFPQDTGGKARDGVWAIDGSIYDNPFLTREAIAEFEALLSDDEKQCRLFGLPLNLSGLVYKEFSWDRHVLKTPPQDWDSFIDPPQNYPVLYFIDPHPQTPHAVLFATVLPSGRRVYFRDLFIHCSVKDLAEQIRDVVRGRYVYDARIDPLAYINDPITETNMAEEFIRNGCVVEKATKALAQGILRVKAELKKDNVLFTPSCVRSLWEIQRYCWDEKENRPIDKDDHMMENLYRCELSEPRFVTRPKTFAIEDFAIDQTDLTLEPLGDVYGRP